MIYYDLLLSIIIDAIYCLLYPIIRYHYQPNSLPGGCDAFFWPWMWSPKAQFPHEPSWMLYHRTEPTSGQLLNQNPSAAKICIVI